MTATMQGALAPVVTPFGPDGAPDPDRLVAHCRWLLAHDCGLAPFGTNSEGNSLAAEEKLDLLDRLIAAGVPSERMMPGTGQCALTDTVRLTRGALAHGCAGVLMLPPFFYKDVSDEGLFRYVSEVVERVGDDRLRIYLYHIPPIAQVGFSLDLLERLISAYPRAVAGIKDSSGDWANTRAMLERFPGFGVFCGNELRLAEARRRGAVGVISATCNINPGPIAALSRDWDAPGADDRQHAINQVRELIQSFPMIQALKVALAHAHNDPDWERVRAPLMPLTSAQHEALVQGLARIGFAMDLAARA